MDISISPPLFFTGGEKMRNFSPFLDPTRSQCSDLKMGQKFKTLKQQHIAPMSGLSSAANLVQLRAHRAGNSEWQYILIATFSTLVFSILSGVNFGDILKISVLFVFFYFLLIC